MAWIRRNIRWIMIASGVLTTTMLQAVVAPEAALRSTFGESLSGPLAEIVVRNWGVLIALIGGMLIYGAFNPPVRPLVLTVASISKAVFIGLVLTLGQHYLGRVGLAVAVDLLMIVLFAWYLLAIRQPSANSRSFAAKVSV